MDWSPRAQGRTRAGAHRAPSFDLGPFGLQQLSSPAYPIAVGSVCLFLVAALLVFSSQKVDVGNQDETASLLERAQEALDRNRLEEAVNHLTRVLSVREGHKLARQGLVDAFMRLGRWDEAQSHLHYLLLHFPEDATVRFLEAAVAFRTGDFSRAGRLADEILAKGDRREEVYKVAALSRFMLGDLEGFQERLSAALERSPEDAELHYHLGRYHFETRNYAKALQAFEEALQLDAGSHRAHYFAGLTQQGGGDRRSAERHFRKAIEIIEERGLKYGWAYADLGQMLVNEGEFQSGLGWLYRGMRNDPSLPYTHFSFASVLLRQHELSVEIELALKQALELDPGYSEAYYLLGRYYARIGERDKAEEAFSRFRELRENPVPSPFGLRR